MAKRRSSLTSDASSVDYLVFNVEHEEIYQFDISDNEYFLIENNKQFEVIVCEQTVELKLAE